MMGLSATRGNLMRSMANYCLRGRGTGSHNTFTTSTWASPNMQTHAATAGGVRQTSEIRRFRGDFVPVYVAIGMIVVQLGIGLQTAMHELMYSPDVHLKKSRRETVPEVEEPDTVVEEGDKFLKKSLFRKVAHAHAQDLELVPRPLREDPLTRPPRAETLKSVGIDPKGH